MPRRASGLHLVRDEDRSRELLTTYEDVLQSRTDHLADDLQIMGKVMESMSGYMGSAVNHNSGQGAFVMTVWRYMFTEYIATANCYALYQRMVAPVPPSRSAYEALMQSMRDVEAMRLAWKRDGRKTTTWDWARYYLGRLGVDWYTLLQRTEPGMANEIAQATDRPPTPKWLERRNATDQKT